MTCWWVADRCVPACPCLFGCELPTDACAGCIALALPGFDLSVENVTLADAAVQALAVQHTDLNLGHVQPTGMFGRVVEFQALKDAVRFGYREGFIQGTGCV